MYTYGGIYLDTDVEVLKSFDTLLHLPYFMGWEFNDRLMEAATFGAEAGCKWLGDCLRYYEGREFFLPNGTMDMKVLPLIMKELIKSNYKIYSLYNLPESYKDNGFYLFQKTIFLLNHVIRERSELLPIRIVFTTLMRHGCLLPFDSLCM